MQSFIVLASLVFELAGGQNDPLLVLNITNNTLGLMLKFFLKRAFRKYVLLPPPPFCGF